MKKTMTGMAILSLIVVGCSQNETFNQIEKKNNAINFSTYTGVTRAAEVTNGTGTNPLTEFMVWTMDNQGNSIDNLDGTVKYTSIDPTNASSNWNNWAADGDVWAYWPTESDKYPIDFYAMYPPTLLLDNTLTPPVTAKTEITISDTGGAPNDYMVATDRRAGTDRIGSKVNFTFKHILSQIRFKAQVTVGYTAVITGIKLVNINSKATYNLIDNTWSTPTTEFTYSVPGTYPVIVTGSSDIYASPTENLMLLPQKTAGPPVDKTNRIWTISPPVTGAYIEVIYALYVTSSGKNIVGRYWDETNDVISPDTDVYAKAAFPLDLSAADYESTGAMGWNPGKIYTYIIDVTGFNGGYNNETNYVEEDGTPGSNTVKRPGDIITIAPGESLIDPPLGLKIDFNVNVENWTDAGNHTINQ